MDQHDRETLRRARKAFNEIAQEDPNSTLQLGNLFLDIFEVSTQEQFVDVCKSVDVPLQLAIHLVEYARIRRGSDGQNRNAVLDTLK